MSKTKSPRLQALAQEGIVVSRWMFHPDCPFCGLSDGGRNLGERPDERHMRSCTSRPLGPKPFERIQVFDSYGCPTSKIEHRERRGSYLGEGVQTTIIYPVRVVRAFPPLDPNSDKPFFHCSYKKKSATVYSWVWGLGEDGYGAWVPWYEFSGEKELEEPSKEIQSEKVRKWLAAFDRNKRGKVR